MVCWWRLVRLWREGGDSSAAVMLQGSAVRGVAVGGGGGEWQ